MGVQTKIGDVFLIPLDEDSSAMGQIVSSWNEELYIAVFDQRISGNEIDAKDATNAKPILLALSLDGKLWNGHWPVIGNVTDNLENFPQPNYKVRFGGAVYIESRDRTWTRPATKEEADILHFRTVSSPMIIEKAIKAHFGIDDWRPNYDELLAKHAIVSAELRELRCHFTKCTE